MKYANNHSINSISYYVDKNIKINNKNMDRCQKGITKILKHQNIRYLQDQYFPNVKMSNSSLNAIPSSFLYFYHNCSDLYSCICNKSNKLCKKWHIARAKKTIW